MVTILYDGSFEGWLTSVFEIYEYKYKEVHIIKEQFYQPSRVDKIHNVYTCQDKAQRVWKGFKTKFSPRLLQHFYHAWLSEQMGIEDVLFYYTKNSFAKRTIAENNFEEKYLVPIQLLVKKVQREVYRVKSFVRFQQTPDNLSYVLIDPDFNVLPLIANHFKEKCAGHCWLIYDTYRKCGIYYDLQSVEMVQLAFTDNSGDVGTVIQHEQKDLYQQMWRTYFLSINKEERKGVTLHIQPVPSKYWKYWMEKKNYM